jgi:hypothetical protein
VGCTDCFQDDAESVGVSLLAIIGINQISIITPQWQATHHLAPGGCGAAPSILRHKKSAA